MQYSFNFPFNNAVILPQAIALNNFSFLPLLYETINNLLKTKLSASSVLKFVELYLHISWKIWNGAVKSDTVNVGHEALCRCVPASEAAKEKKRS